MGPLAQYQPTISQLSLIFLFWLRYSVYKVLTFSKKYKNICFSWHTPVIAIIYINNLGNLGFQAPIMYCIEYTSCRYHLCVVILNKPLTNKFWKWRVGVFVKSSVPVPWQKIKINFIWLQKMKPVSTLKKKWSPCVQSWYFYIGI